MKRLLMITSPALLALAMILAALGLLPRAVAAVGEPPAGTTQSIQNYTLFATQQITSPGETTTTNGTAQHVQYWNAADIFINADVDTDGIITVTAQLSADNSNFVDAAYTYLADTLIETVTVLTSTGLTTATATLSNSSTPTEQTYQVVLSADGTDYLRLPIAGQYLRVSLAYTGTVTPTVITTLRNN